MVELQDQSIEEIEAPVEEMDSFEEIEETDSFKEVETPAVEMESFEDIEEIDFKDDTPKPIDPDPVKARELYDTVEGAKSTDEGFNSWYKNLSSEGGLQNAWRDLVEKQAFDGTYPTFVSYINGQDTSDEQVIYEATGEELEISNVELEKIRKEDVVKIATEERDNVSKSLVERNAKLVGVTYADRKRLKEEGELHTSQAINKVMVEGNERGDGIEWIDPYQFNKFKNETFHKDNVEAARVSKRTRIDDFFIYGKALITGALKGAITGQDMRVSVKEAVTKAKLVSEGSDQIIMGRTEAIVLSDYLGVVGERLQHLDKKIKEKFPDAEEKMKMLEAYHEQSGGQFTPEQVTELRETGLLDWMMSYENDPDVDNFNRGVGKYNEAKTELSGLGQKYPLRKAVNDLKMKDQMQYDKLYRNLPTWQKSLVNLAENVAEWVLKPVDLAIGILPTIGAAVGSDTAGSVIGGLSEIDDLSKIDQSTTAVQRKILSRVAIFEGHQVIVDSNNNPIDVRDGEGYSTFDPLGDQNIIEKYKKSGATLPTTVFHPDAFASNLVNIGGDFLWTVLLTKGFQSAGFAKNLSKGSSDRLASFIVPFFQYAPGMSKDAIKQGFSPTAAARYGLWQAMIEGATEVISPLEAVLARGNKLNTAQAARISGLNIPTGKKVWMGVKDGWRIAIPEMSEEILALWGNSYTDALLSEKGYNFILKDDSALDRFRDELPETLILTAGLMGPVSTYTALKNFTYTTGDGAYNEYVFQAASDPERFYSVSEGIKKGLGSNMYTARQEQGASETERTAVDVVQTTALINEEQVIVRDLNKEYKELIDDAEVSDTDKRKVVGSAHSIKKQEAIVAEMPDGIMKTRAEQRLEQAKEKLNKFLTDVLDNKGKAKKEKPATAPPPPPDEDIEEGEAKPFYTKNDVADNLTEIDRMQSQSGDDVIVHIDNVGNEYYEVPFEDGTVIIDGEKYAEWDKVDREQSTALENATPETFDNTRNDFFDKKREVIGKFTTEELAEKNANNSFKEGATVTFENGDKAEVISVKKKGRGISEVVLQTPIGRVTLNNAAQVKAAGAKLKKYTPKLSKAINNRGLDKTITGNIGRLAKISRNDDTSISRKDNIVSEIDKQLQARGFELVVEDASELQKSGVIQQLGNIGNTPVVLGSDGKYYGHTETGWKPIESATVGDVITYGTDTPISNILNKKLRYDSDIDAILVDPVMSSRHFATGNDAIINNINSGEVAESDPDILAEYLESLPVLQQTETHKVYNDNGDIIVVDNNGTILNEGDARAVLDTLVDTPLPPGVDEILDDALDEKGSESTEEFVRERLGDDYPGPWTFDINNTDVSILPKRTPKAIKKKILNVIKALSKVMPNIKIQVHTNQTWKRGDVAAYIPSKQMIMINIDRISDKVFAHEVIHPVLIALRQHNKELYQQIENEIYDAFLGGDIKALDEFAKGYADKKDAVKRHEILTEFLARVVEGEIKLAGEDVSALNKAIKALVKFINSVIGFDIDSVFNIDDLSTSEDIVHLSNLIRDILDGSEILDINERLNGKDSTFDEFGDEISFSYLNKEGKAVMNDVMNMFHNRPSRFGTFRNFRNAVKLLNTQVNPKTAFKTNYTNEEAYEKIVADGIPEGVEIPRMTTEEHYSEGLKDLMAEDALSSVFGPNARLDYDELADLLHAKSLDDGIRPMSEVYNLTNWVNRNGLWMSGYAQRTAWVDDYMGKLMSSTGSIVTVEQLLTDPKNIRILQKYPFLKDIRVIYKIGQKGEYGSYMSTSITTVDDVKNSIISNIPLDKTLSPEQLDERFLEIESIVEGAMLGQKSALAELSRLMPAYEDADGNFHVPDDIDRYDIPTWVTNILKTDDLIVLTKASLLSGESLPTLLHELQHAIQQYEGWPKGVNSDYITEDIFTSTAAFVPLNSINRADNIANDASNIIKIKKKGDLFTLPFLDMMTGQLLNIGFSDLSDAVSAVATYMDHINEFRIIADGIFMDSLRGMASVIPGVKSDKYEAYSPPARVRAVAQDLYLSSESESQARLVESGLNQAFIDDSDGAYNPIQHLENASLIPFFIPIGQVSTLDDVKKGLAEAAKVRDSNYIKYKLDSLIVKSRHEGLITDLKKRPQQFNPFDSYQITTGGETALDEDLSYNETHKNQIQEAYPDAIVVENESDLPKHLQDQIAEMNATGETKALIDNYNGRVYMISSAIDSMEDADKSYRHEVLGHKNVIEMLADRLDTVAISIVDNSKGDQRKRIEERSKFYYYKAIKDLTDEEKSQVGQEYIAKIAENPKLDTTAFESIANTIRDILRSLGLTLSITDAEIKQLIRSAAKQRASKISDNLAVFLTTDLDSSFDGYRDSIAELILQGFDRSTDATVLLNMAQIREANRDKESYLKAPNGQDTRMSEADWLYARTDHFTSQYGDWETKIETKDYSGFPFKVDANGEPIIKNSESKYSAPVNLIKNERLFKHLRANVNIEGVSVEQMHKALLNAGFDSFEFEDEQIPFIKQMLDDLYKDRNKVLDKEDDFNFDIEEFEKQKNGKLIKLNTVADLDKYKHYYAPGERLCTYNNPEGRLKNYDIWVFVRNDADKIDRDDYDNPNLYDDYSTSVLMFQRAKSGYSGSDYIISRYNHGADTDVDIANFVHNAVFDRFYKGLSKHLGQSKEKIRKENTRLGSNYKIRDGKIYKFEFEENGNTLYASKRGIIYNGNITPLNPDYQKYIGNGIFIDNRIKNLFFAGVNLFSEDNKKISIDGNVITGDDGQMYNGEEFISNITYAKEGEIFRLIGIGVYTFPKLIKTDAPIILNSAALNAPILREAKAIRLTSNSIFDASSLTSSADISVLDDSELSAPLLSIIGKSNSIVVGDNSTFFADRLNEVSTLHVRHSSRISMPKLTRVSSTLRIHQSEVDLPSLVMAITLEVVGGGIITAPALSRVVTMEITDSEFENNNIKSLNFLAVVDGSITLPNLEVIIDSLTATKYDSPVNIKLPNVRDIDAVYLGGVNIELPKLNEATKLQIADRGLLKAPSLKKVSNIIYMTGVSSLEADMLASVHTIEAYGGNRSIFPKLKNITGLLRVDYGSTFNADNLINVGDIHVSDSVVSIPNAKVAKDIRLSGQSSIEANLIESIGNLDILGVEAKFIAKKLNRLNTLNLIFRAGFDASMFMLDVPELKTATSIQIDGSSIIEIPSLKSIGGVGLTDGASLITNAQITQSVIISGNSELIANNITELKNVSLRHRGRLITNSLKKVTENLEISGNTIFINNSLETVGNVVIDTESEFYTDSLITADYITIDGNSTMTAAKLETIDAISLRHSAALITDSLKNIKDIVLGQKSLFKANVLESASGIDIVNSQLQSPLLKKITAITIGSSSIELQSLVSVDNYIKLDRARLEVGSLTTAKYIKIFGDESKLEAPKLTTALDIELIREGLLDRMREVRKEAPTRYLIDAPLLETAREIVLNHRAGAILPELKNIQFINVTDGSILEVEKLVDIEQIIVNGSELIAPSLTTAEQIAVHDTAVKFPLLTTVKDAVWVGSGGSFTAPLLATGRLKLDLDSIRKQGKGVGTIDVPLLLELPSPSEELSSLSDDSRADQVMAKIAEETNSDKREALIEAASIAFNISPEEIKERLKDFKGDAAVHRLVSKMLAAIDPLRGQHPGVTINTITNSVTKKMREKGYSEEEYPDSYFKDLVTAHYTGSRQSGYRPDPDTLSDKAKKKLTELANQVTAEYDAWRVYKDNREAYRRKFKHELPYIYLKELSEGIDPFTIKKKKSKTAKRAGISDQTREILESIDVEERSDAEQTRLVEGIWSEMSNATGGTDLDVAREVLGNWRSVSDSATKLKLLRKAIRIAQLYGDLGLQYDLMAHATRVKSDLGRGLRAATGTEGLHVDALDALFNQMDESEMEVLDKEVEGKSVKDLIKEILKLVDIIPSTKEAIAASIKSLIASIDTGLSSVHARKMFFNISDLLTPQELALPLDQMQDALRAKLLAAARSYHIRQDARTSLDKKSAIDKILDAAIRPKTKQIPRPNDIRNALIPFINGLNSVDWIPFLRDAISNAGTLLQSTAATPTEKGLAAAYADNVRNQFMGVTPVTSNIDNIDPALEAAIVDALADMRSAALLNANIAAQLMSRVPGLTFHKAQLIQAHLENNFSVLLTPQEKKALRDKIIKVVGKPNSELGERIFRRFAAGDFTEAEMLREFANHLGVPVLTSEERAEYGALMQDVMAARNPRDLTNSYKAIAMFTDELTARHGVDMKHQMSVVLDRMIGHGYASMLSGVQTWQRAYISAYLEQLGKMFLDLGFSVLTLDADLPRIAFRALREYMNFGGLNAIERLVYNGDLFYRIVVKDEPLDYKFDRDGDPKTSSSELKDAKIENNWKVFFKYLFDNVTGDFTSPSEMIDKMRTTRLPLGKFGTSAIGKLSEVPVTIFDMLMYPLLKPLVYGFRLIRFVDAMFTGFVDYELGVKEMQDQLLGGDSLTNIIAVRDMQQKADQAEIAAQVAAEGLTGVAAIRRKRDLWLGTRDSKAFNSAMHILEVVSLATYTNGFLGKVSLKLDRATMGRSNNVFQKLFKIAMMQVVPFIKVVGGGMRLMTRATPLVGGLIDYGYTVANGKYARKGVPSQVLEYNSEEKKHVWRDNSRLEATRVTTRTILGIISVALIFAELFDLDEDEEYGVTRIVPNSDANIRITGFGTGFFGSDLKVDKGYKPTSIQYKADDGKWYTILDYSIIPSLAPIGALFGNIYDRYALTADKFDKGFVVDRTNVYKGDEIDTRHRADLATLFTQQMYSLHHIAFETSVAKGIRNVSDLLAEFMDKPGTSSQIKKENEAARTQGRVSRIAGQMASQYMKPSLYKQILAFYKADHGIPLSANPNEGVLNNIVQKNMRDVIGLNLFAKALYGDARTMKDEFGNPIIAEQDFFVVGDTKDDYVLPEGWQQRPYAEYLQRRKEFNPLYEKIYGNTDINSLSRYTPMSDVNGDFETIPAEIVDEISDVAAITLGYIAMSPENLEELLAFDSDDFISAIEKMKTASGKIAKSVVLQRYFNAIDPTILDYDDPVPLKYDSLKNFLGAFGSEDIIIKKEVEGEKKKWKKKEDLPEELTEIRETGITMSADGHFRIGKKTQAYLKEKHPVFYKWAVVDGKPIQDALPNVTDIDLVEWATWDEDAIILRDKILKRITSSQ